MRIVRELGKSYLVENDMTDNKYEYKRRMLTENHIPNIPECRCSVIDSEDVLKFDISNMRSIKREYEDKRMTYQELCKLIYTITQILCQSNAYMFEDSGFIFDPNYIFRDMEDDCLYMIYLPFSIETQDYTKYYKLADFFLEKIDHKNEHAVNIAYQFYRMSKEETFMITGFLSLIEKENMSISDVREKYTEENDESEKGYIGDTGDIYDINMSTYEEDGITENTNTKRKNAKEGAAKWIPVAVSLFVAIASFFVYKVYIDEIVYVSYLILLVILCLIFAIGMTIKNVVRIIDNHREEVPDIGENVTVDEYWGKEEMLSDDEVTQFFDVKPDKREYIINWDEDGISQNKVISAFPVTMGKKSEDVDITISDDSVSRKHARIFKRNSQLTLMDLHSTNGTYVNGSKIVAGSEVPISDKDEIYFGKVRVTVV